MSSRPLKISVTLCETNSFHDCFCGTRPLERVCACVHPPVMPNHANDDDRNGSLFLSHTYYCSTVGIVSKKLFNPAHARKSLRKSESVSQSVRSSVWGRAKAETTVWLIPSSLLFFLLPSFFFHIPIWRPHQPTTNFVCGLCSV